MQSYKNTLINRFLFDTMFGCQKGKLAERIFIYTNGTFLFDKCETELIMKQAVQKPYTVLIKQSKGRSYYVFNSSQS